MRHLILDPATQQAQLVDDTDGHDLTDRIIIVVDDDFSWSTSAIDWSTTMIVPNTEKALADLRARRTDLLFATDWWMMADVIAAASPELQEARLAYRQALRDWPATETDPFDPTEPTMPA